MTNAKRKPFLTTRELATVAILAAISAVLFMIEIPVVLFYKLDLSLSLIHISEPTRH